MSIPLPRLARHHLALAVLTLASGVALTAGAQDVPLAASAPVKGGAVVSAQARTTLSRDNLWNIAGALRRDRSQTRQQLMVAILRANPEAFEGGNIHRLRRGVALNLPSAANIAAEDRSAAEALVAQHLEAMRTKVAVSPLPAVGAAPVVPSPGAAASAVSQPAAPRASASVSEASAPRAAAVPDATPAEVKASAPVVASAPSTTPVQSPEPAKAPDAPASMPSTPSVAPAASVASVPAPSPASSASSTMASAPNADSGNAAWWRWWPALLFVTVSGVGIWAWRRQSPASADGAGTAASGATDTGLSSAAAAEPRRQRSLTVSDAAAEMARTVETLKPAALMVAAPEGAVAAPVAVAPLLSAAAEVALRLDLARACLDLGRTADARVLLEQVQRDGSEADQALAAEWLASLTPAAS